MKFIKYNSIENSYRQEFIDKIITEGKAHGEWFVAEKIHGANFSIWMNRTRTRIAKRTCFLADDDNFYGVQELKEGILKKARHIYREAFPQFPEQLVIFGELFGGTYPHPEVKIDPKAKKVQKGVYYCPHNDFIVYDIKVGGRFLNFETMQIICEQVGLRFVKTIFKGSFKECLEYPNDFLSTIYREYGLPPIEGNICEGIVIRPNDTRFLNNQKRIILKSKNDKFKEKERKPEKIKVELPEEGKKALEEMLSMITENRYDSAISKIGEVKMSDFGKIQGMIQKDIYEELMKNTKMYFDYNNLEKVEKKLIQKTVGREVASLIRKKLLGREKE